MPESKVRFGEGPKDFQQSEWLAEKLGKEWRYDFSTEQWHHFDGYRWATDKTAQVKRIVAEAAAKGLFDRADLTEQTRKALTKLLSLNPIDKALEALATQDDYGTDGSDWDTTPYLLGTPSGIVDLRKNAIIPATPEMLVTRSTGVPFTPINDPSDFSVKRRGAPLFIEKMKEWTSDYDWTEDPSMVSFLLLWFGAGMFGFAPEEKFLLMTGRGRNGKGSIKTAVMAAIGEEYGCEPDGNLYSRNKFGPARSSDARADLMSLRGRRIAFFNEPDRGQFNEEMLKAHTGGDMITARNLYQKVPQSWEPTHSITFLVNDSPSIDDLGPSMADRVLVADFRHSWEGKDADPRLKGMLRKEAPGILAILCWAAAAWWRDLEATGKGLNLPPRVVEQSKAFMERNDPVAEALREAFRVEPGVSCGGQPAYEAYRDWHTRTGREEDPMSMVKFTSELEKKGFQRYRSMSSRGWKGLQPLGAMALAEQEAEE